MSAVLTRPTLTTQPDAWALMQALASSRARLQDMDASLSTLSTVALWDRHDIFEELTEQAATPSTMVTPWLYHVVAPLALAQPDVWGPAPVALWTDDLLPYHQDMLDMAHVETDASDQASQEKGAHRALDDVFKVHLAPRPAASSLWPWQLVLDVVLAWRRHPVEAKTPPQLRSQARTHAHAGAVGMWSWWFRVTKAGRRAVQRYADTSRYRVADVHAMVWLCDVAMSTAAKQNWPDAPDSIDIECDLVAAALDL